MRGTPRVKLKPCPPSGALPPAVPPQGGECGAPAGRWPGGGAWTAWRLRQQHFYKSCDYGPGWVLSPSALHWEHRVSFQTPGSRGSERFNDLLRTAQQVGQVGAVCGSCSRDLPRPSAEEAAVLVLGVASGPRGGAGGSPHTPHREDAPRRRKKRRLWHLKWLGSGPAVAATASGAAQLPCCKNSPPPPASRGSGRTGIWGPTGSGVPMRTAMPARVPVGRGRGLLLRGVWRRAGIMGLSGAGRGGGRGGRSCPWKARGQVRRRQ